ncbi:MAG: hypothetical protein IPL35_17225 [Sphingobacteriales bacterium]|nr:hypothetical protein [Sphingobacteriales bacterium]
MPQCFVAVKDADEEKEWLLFACKRKEIKEAALSAAIFFRVAKIAINYKFLKSDLNLLEIYPKVYAAIQNKCCIKQAFEAGRQ